jgi:hypothetical protein
MEAARRIAGDRLRRRMSDMDGHPNGSGSTQMAPWIALEPRLFAIPCHVTSSRRA